MLSLAVCIGTYGDRFWPELAKARALPSVYMQGSETQVVHLYKSEMRRHEIRNAIAQLVTADWLCFLDADDMLAPGFVHAIRSADPPDTRTLLNPAVAPLEEPDNANLFERTPLHRRNWLVIGTVISRELFLEVGGFRNWPFFEDWELWIRCEKAGATVQQVPEAVYLVGQTDRSRDRTAGAREMARTLYEIRWQHYPELYRRPPRVRVLKP